MNIKIVVVGIGSASFGPKTLGDIFSPSELAGSTLCLVDIQAESLELMGQLATRMNQEWASGLKIETSRELADALPGADFVICMLEANRDQLWQRDMQIPHKYGVMQVLGENGGPGGLAHTLRTAPLVLEVAQQMDRLCPDAWFLNYTNPLPRVCRAVKKYSDVKVVGFCHGIGNTLDTVGDILQLDQAEIDLTAAGLNHFHWVLNVRRKSTGEDLYGELRDREADFEPGRRRLWRDLFHRFGYMPFTSDDHIGEYLPFMHVDGFGSWEKYGHDHWLLHWDGNDTRRTDRWEEIKSMISGDQSIEPLRSGSGERAIPVLLALGGGTPDRELALNIPNRGYITDLPEDCIVEVPAAVDACSVTGEAIGKLPAAIAAWCSNQVQVAELAVDAAVLGDRSIALQALLADPVINDIDVAEKILDEYLAVHADWLPQFSA
jgi:alpha-galactosidase